MRCCVAAAALILVNPTAGVDVAAEGSIITSVAGAIGENNRAGLIIFSDESEFAACSRLVGMFRGRILGELTAPWTESDLAAAVQGDITLAQQQLRTKAENDREHHNGHHEK